MQTSDNWTRRDCPHAVGQILGNKHYATLQQIIRQAQRLIGLNELLKRCLPKELNPHCTVIHATPTELTIGTHSAAWSTHLRFLQPQLLAQLRQHPQCLHVQTIKIKIQPLQPSALPAPPQPRYLSPANCQLLREQAHMIKDTPLRNALEKLARHQ